MADMDAANHECAEWEVMESGSNDCRVKCDL